LKKGTEKVKKHEKGDHSEKGDRFIFSPSIQRSKALENKSAPFSFSLFSSLSCLVRI